MFDIRQKFEHFFGFQLGERRNPRDFDSLGDQDCLRQFGRRGENSNQTDVKIVF